MFSPGVFVSQIFGRYMWLFLRNPVWVVIGVIQPVFYLILFAPLLESIAKSPGFPLMLALLALLGLMMTPVSYAVALWLRSEDSFAPLIFTVSLPLLLLSGVLLPLSFAPSWLRAIAAANPLAYAVDASRAIFNNRLTDPSIGIAVAIMAVLAAIAVSIAARQFGRAVA